LNWIEEHIEAHSLGFLGGLFPCAPYPSLLLIGVIPTNQLKDR